MKIIKLNEDTIVRKVYKDSMGNIRDKYTNEIIKPTVFFKDGSGGMGSSAVEHGEDDEKQNDDGKNTPDETSNKNGNSFDKASEEEKGDVGGGSASPEGDSKDPRGYSKGGRDTRDSEDGQADKSDQRGQGDKSSNGSGESNGSSNGQGSSGEESQGNTSNNDSQNNENGQSGKPKSIDFNRNFLKKKSSGQGYKFVPDGKLYKHDDKVYLRNRINGDYIEYTGAWRKANTQEQKDED